MWSYKIEFSFCQCSTVFPKDFKNTSHCNWSCSPYPLIGLSIFLTFTKLQQCLNLVQGCSLVSKSARFSSIATFLISTDPGARMYLIKGSFTSTSFVLSWNIWLFEWQIAHWLSHQTEISISRPFRLITKPLTHVLLLLQEPYTLL